MAANTENPAAAPPLPAAGSPPPPPLPAAAGSPENLDARSAKLPEENPQPEAENPAPLPAAGSELPEEHRQLKRANSAIAAAGSPANLGDCSGEIRQQKRRRTSPAALEKLSAASGAAAKGESEESKGEFSFSFDTWDVAQVETTPRFGSFNCAAAADPPPLGPPAAAEEGGAGSDCGLSGDMVQVPTFRL